MTGNTRSEKNKENVSFQDCQLGPGMSLQLGRWAGPGWPPAWEEIRAFSLVSVDQLPLFLSAKGELGGEHGHGLLPSSHILSPVNGEDFFVPFHFPGEGPVNG